MEVPIDTPDLLTPRAIVQGLPTSYFPLTDEIPFGDISMDSPDEEPLSTPTENFISAIAPRGSKRKIPDTNTGGSYRSASRRDRSHASEGEEVSSVASWYSGTKSRLRTDQVKPSLILEEDHNMMGTTGFATIDPSDRPTILMVGTCGIAHLFELMYTDRFLDEIR